MSDERFQRMKEIFKEALQLAPSDRLAFLDDACKGDPALRARIDKLLASDEEEDSFLETPAVAAIPVDRTGAPPPGTRLGRYLLGRVIAAGGMGIVYEARQEDLERTVAVKVMQEGILSKSSERRFEYEGELLARLKHKNIARVIETCIRKEGSAPAGKDAWHAPFMVMEYIHDARAVTEYALENNLTVKERLALFLQICDAVHHGHQKGVIHRDLKPGNILVGAEGVVKVIDFGVARVLETDPTLTAVQTQSGQLIGTLQYMSPEQCLGNREDLDIRTDLYSLGVVLFELLCDSLPYDVRKTTIFEAARIIREKAPERPGEINRALKGDLETIILKAMEKERGMRYQSVLDLANDIRRHLGGEVIWAHPAGPLLRSWKRIKRNPIVSAASGVALVAVAAFLVATPWYMERLTDERDRARIARTKALDGARQAREQEGLANARYEEIIRLSDIKLLNQLEAEANTLWPAVPGNMARMEDWRNRAGELLQRLDAHNRRLEVLREEALPDPENSGQEDARSRSNWEFIDHKKQWQHDILQDLVEELKRFADNRSGTIKHVTERLVFAGTVEEKTILNHREAWNKTIEAIADRKSSPLYKGLGIKSQLGLIPIGRDPDSGLFEFAHLQTGKVPERGPDGKLELREETGLIFIFIPGGTFDMGVTLPGPGKPEGSPNVDSHALKSESPVHSVTIDPFFISKYEMTQGQWARFTGKNPCMYPAGSSIAGKQVTLLHPVEHVSWRECVEVLGRLGLRFPTESEWEYAERAGTNTVWWTGNHKSTLGGEDFNSVAANIMDAYGKEKLKSSDLIYESWLNDGHMYHAPVGSFRANPFGLHDVAGNVWELCQDSGHSSFEGAPDDGSAWIDEVSKIKIIRGGSYMVSASECRSASRAGSRVDQRSAAFGFRPALDLRIPEK